MPNIKIIKAIAKDCNLKDERNARIRDSKFNKLVYYDGHIELINDTIDEITLYGKNSSNSGIYSVDDLLHRGLEISNSTIKEITMIDDCRLRLGNLARVNNLMCTQPFAEASIHGEAHVGRLILEAEGAMSTRHGQIDNVEVHRGGKLYVAERAVISRCVVSPTGEVRVGYRHGSAQTVPVIHHLKLYDNAILNIKGDVAIGELEVCCNAKVQRQFIATVFIGKLFEDRHPVTNVELWLHKHSVDAIA